MNEEQNTPEQAPGAGENTNKAFGSDKAKGADDYYSVDNPKQEVHTNIGDGVMRDEGLVGDGSIPDESPFTAGGTTDEQDEAEQTDRQG